jgi:hypothetical protein
LDKNFLYDLISHIKFRVTDELGLTSTLQTTIEIKDDNEFAPVVTSSTEAFGSITESSPGGTLSDNKDKHIPRSFLGTMHFFYRKQMFSDLEKATA